MILSWKYFLLKLVNCRIARVNKKYWTLIFPEKYITVKKFTFDFGKNFFYNKHIRKKKREKV